MNEEELKYISFPKRLFWRAFLGISALLLASLFLQEHIFLYKSIEFLAIYVAMAFLISFIVGIALIVISYGEKHIEADIQINKYQGKKNYSQKKITSSGVYFLFIFLWVIPISLFSLQYYFVREIEYRLLFYYLLLLLPFWISVFLLMSDKLESFFRKN